MLKFIALRTIALYQRYLSPKKGFGCAYRVRVGGTGCSGFGKRVIEKRGFFLGLVLLRRRLSKCAWHAQQQSPRAALPRNMALRGQGGFVDCGGCDAPSCDVPSCDVPSCDVPSCHMPDCDLPSCHGPNCDVPHMCGGGGRTGGFLSNACDVLDVFSCGGGGGSTGETRRQARMKKRRDDKEGSEE